MQLIMKKYFIDFLKAFCAYDEFLEAFTASQKYFDFDYYLKYTDPSVYIVGAFPHDKNPFTTSERLMLYAEWSKRLNQLKQIKDDSNN